MTFKISVLTILDWWSRNEFNIIFSGETEIVSWLKSQNIFIYYHVKILFTSVYCPISM